MSGALSKRRERVKVWVFAASGALCAAAVVEPDASRPAAGTRSASTQPASTLASWSRSPRSTSRASGCTASSRRRIIVRSTIDTSSTMTSCAGIGLTAVCRLLPSGRTPTSRCSVVAGSDCSRARTSSETSNTGCAVASVASRMASRMRPAALPVGAASATGCVRPSIKAASRRVTEKVLPVPGPPTISARRFVAARRTARAASPSGPSVPAPLGNSRASVASRSVMRAASGTSQAARAMSAVATRCCSTYIRRVSSSGASDALRRGCATNGFSASSGPPTMGDAIVRAAHAVMSVGHGRSSPSSTWLCR